jgi:V/A-type H+-transporting ATPase subunit E
VLNIVGSELRAVRDRIIGSMELEGRKILMNSRGELFTSVFEEAEKRLWEIASGRDETINFGEVLFNLIVEAASAMGGDEFIVAANERDIGYLRENLKEVEERLKKNLGEVNIRLDANPVATMGGVIVRNKDGDKIFYNTLEGRLKSVRSRIEAEVAKTLGVL